MKRAAHKPRLLDDEQERLLNNRIALSKTLGFPLPNLSSGWGISLATLHRYKSPEYRLKSQEYARKNLSYRSSMYLGACYSCHVPHDDHAKCADCTILLHPDSPFGDSPDGVRCQGCIDSRLRKRMKGLKQSNHGRS